MALTTYQAKRRELVEELRSKGIQDSQVLQAIGTLPREEFVLPAFKANAYDDTALPIICKQTISQPYTVAYMTELLGVQPGDRVLEIGTGSGYQAAVLATMGACVFTVERHQELHEAACKIFEALNLSIAAYRGDGTLGWSSFGPYQGIIVTAAAPDVPTSLANQLAIGGRLVIPVGDKDQQKLYRVVRTGEDDFSGEELEDFRFVPLIGRQGWEK